MKKKNITIFIIVGSLIVCFPIACFSGSLFYFWYHDTHTGSFSGRVIDGVTSEPIEGAVVSYHWRFGGFMGISAESWAASYETVTDKDGKYFIPNQRTRRHTILDGTLEPESVLIYKNNYAVYDLWGEYRKPTVGRSFGYPRKNQPYSRKNNLVKLYPWKIGESHDTHLDYIRLSHCYRTSTNLLLEKELQEEEKRAKEERRKKYNR
ncbi:MAG: carboxypeptidase-like regulatory domain-containing protein [Planctomycetota bacterium]